MFVTEDVPAVPDAPAGGGEAEESAEPGTTAVEREREYLRLRCKLKPSQRRYLHALAKSGFKLERTRKAVGVGAATLHAWKRNPDFQRYRELSLERYREELDINEMSLLIGYRDEEEADYRLLYDPVTNELLPPNKWPDREARCVSEYGFDRQGKPYVKLVDKRGARDRLAKFMQMFVERHEVTGKGGAPLAAPTILIGGPPEPDEPGEG
jgi:hypothetical protein